MSVLIPNPEECHLFLPLNLHFHSRSWDGDYLLIHFGFCLQYRNFPIIMPTTLFLFALFNTSIHPLQNLGIAITNLKDSGFKNAWDTSECVLQSPACLRRIAKSNSRKLLWRWLKFQKELSSKCITWGEDKSYMRWELLDFLIYVSPIVLSAKAHRSSTIRWREKKQTNQSKQIKQPTKQKTHHTQESATPVFYHTHGVSWGQTNKSCLWLTTTILQRWKIMHYKSKAFSLV